MTWRQTNHRMIPVASTFLLGMNFACGGSDGSGGEDSGTGGDNNGTGGGTPVELSSIEDGEALFKFSGAFNETIRFAPQFSPNSGWRTFKGPDGQGELETRASSLDYWAEDDDGQLSVSLNGARNVPRRLFLKIFSRQGENLIGIHVEDILSAAVYDSIRRAERGVFRPEIPVFGLCMIVSRFRPGICIGAPF